MRTLLAGLAMPFCLAVLCVAANADSRILEVWVCQLNDGQTMDGVKAENANWKKYVNDNVSGGDIESYIVTPVVGAQGQFMYVDSFPGMAAWIATKDAISKDEGVAIEEALSELATCVSNSLHNSEQT